MYIHTYTHTHTHTYAYRPICIDVLMCMAHVSDISHHHCYVSNVVSKLHNNLCNVSPNISCTTQNTTDRVTNKELWDAGCG